MNFSLACVPVDINSKGVYKISRSTVYVRFFARAMKYTLLDKEWKCSFFSYSVDADGGLYACPMEL